MLSSRRGVGRRENKVGVTVVTEQLWSVRSGPAGGNV